jgi:hypothetical protein
MPFPAWSATLLMAAGAIAFAPTARGDEPASLALARRAVEEARGAEHREKMRITWPAVEDESPPDGSEVVLVSGYISYRASRFVLREDTVEAGSVVAARSWFYNRKGESFGVSEWHVSRERFVVAWNAMQRILAASDERIAPEPEDHPLDIWFISESHESADWIRVRRGEESTPVHCAGRPSRLYDWDDVRMWDGLRDEAVFEVFRELLPAHGAAPRPGAVAPWGRFAGLEIGAAAKVLDVERVRRDEEFLETCLRVAGEAGDEACEDDVAALGVALDALDDSAWPVKALREEVSLVAVRLRLRLHWSRDEAVRALRALPDGTWAREDQGKWLRETFRAKDPAGWAEFLVDEATRGDARPGDVAEAASGLRDLPAEVSVPALRALLAREDPYVRLEAALALRVVAPEDEQTRAAVVALALDRRIECDRRPDLVDRWSRSRALAAALDWGGLSTTALRSHLLAPEVDRPQLLAEGLHRLADTPEALTSAEAADAWRRVLDSATGPDVVAAVHHLLLQGGDTALRPSILAALDRLADDESVDHDDVVRLRERVATLDNPDDDEK